MFLEVFLNFLGQNYRVMFAHVDLDTRKRFGSYIWCSLLNQHTEKETSCVQKLQF